MANKTVYKWCWMWQSDKKDEIEVIKEGLEFFIKRYGERPDLIYIFKDGKNTTHDRINLIKDKSLFHVGLIMIPIPILEIKDDT